MTNEMLRSRLIALYERKTPTVDLLDFLDILLDEVITLQMKVRTLEYRVDFMDKSEDED